MMPNSELMQSYVSKLGLDEDIARLYMALYMHGPQTLSGLARLSSVERTRIYRLLDSLNTSHLIEVEIKHKRNIYKAAPIGNLRLVIAHQEQRLKELQLELEQIEQALPHNMLTSANTRVQFYEGEEGLKQMFWNQAKTRTDVLAILHRNMQIKTGDSFFDRWIETHNSSGARVRGLVGDDFIASQKAWYKNGETSTRMSNWQPRYISPDAFPITHSEVIYDDVVAFYNWRDEEIFGIEIYNQQIANAQRYFFKAYWQLGVPINDVTGKPKTTKPPRKS